MASGKVFGRPLDKLLEADRKIRPTLQVPLIVYEAVRCINRHGKKIFVQKKMSTIFEKQRNSNP